VDKPFDSTVVHQPSLKGPDMRDTDRRVARDGSIDYEYTWGRPVTTYLSTLDYMRLLLFKARLSALSKQDAQH
jgi:hypothetical protein